MTQTIVLKNLPDSSPTSVNLYTLPTSLVLRSTVNTPDGLTVYSDFVVPTGDTDVETVLRLKSTLDKNGIRHITATLSTVRVCTDSVLGEIARDPVSFTLGWNHPAAFLDNDALVKGVTTVLSAVLGDLTGGEADSTVVAALNRQLTTSYGVPA